MVRLAWATDIHLNLLDRPDRVEFADAIAAAAPDALAISGDIATAPTLPGALAFLAERLARPIYFVLGNHDFYRGSIAGVRATARDLARVAVAALAAGRRARRARARRRPARARRLVGRAPRGLRRLARHDPRLQAHRGPRGPRPRRPPRAACWYEGKVCDDDWLPHFSCKAVGDALAEAMRARPDRERLVLCGHTHGAGVVRVLPNLEVRTGGAEYGRPVLQGVLDLSPLEA